MSNILENLVKEVIAESTKVNFGEHQFLMKVSTNEDPQKSGIRIMFVPLVFGSMNTTVQNDVAIELESRLERGLSKYGLRVERDRQIKDKSSIAFFIYIEYFDRLIRLALTEQNPADSDKKE